MAQFYTGHNNAYPAPPQHQYFGNPRPPPLYSDPYSTEHTAMPAAYPPRPQPYRDYDAQPPGPREPGALYGGVNYATAPAVYAAPLEPQQSSFANAASPVQPPAAHAPEVDARVTLALRRRAELGPPPAPFDGVALLQQQGFTMDTIVGARAEHAPRKLPFAADGDQISQHAGHGVRVYFDAVKIIGLMTLVVAGFQVWVYVRASNDVGGFKYRQNPINRDPWYFDFFAGHFVKSTRDLWYGINVWCFILAFSTALWLNIYTKCRWGDRQPAAAVPTVPTAAAVPGLGLGGAVTVTAAQPPESTAVPLVPVPGQKTDAVDKIIRLTATGAIDVSARYRSDADLLARRVASLFVFAMFLVLQIFITFGLSTVSNNASFGLSFLISLVAVIIDAVYTFTATAFTEFEKHLTNSKATRWLTLKLMCFKVANIMGLYAGLSLNTAHITCAYGPLGEQFLALWFVLIVLTIPTRLIMTMVWANNFQVYARLMGSISSDNSSMPYFEVSSEYLSLLYVGFLTYAGMVVFPLSSLLALLTIVLLYWSAKFRMAKLCGRPLLLDHSSRLLVGGGLVLAALAGLLTPTAGGAFILSGYTARQTNTTCALP